MVYRSSLQQTLWRLELMPSGVYERTAEHRKIIAKSARGRRHSQETRAKMSAAKKGITPINFAQFLAKAHATPKLTGEANPIWKGDSVGYSALHAWVRRKLGTPNLCGRCNTTTAKRYEWANISGEYKRDLSDWIRLCTSCHRKEGFARGEYTSWIKGTNRQTNTGRTHIKKGQRIGRATEFKKGQAAHNKYLTPRECVQCKTEFQPFNHKRKYCSQRCYWDSLKRHEPRFQRYF